MHEYSLACEIMEHVISIAETNDAKTVNEIVLGVGKLTHVNPEQMMFCLEILRNDTIAENAEIVLEDIYPDMECDCGYSQNGKGTCIEKGMDDIRSFLEVNCPVCGNILQVSGGRELIIRSIDIDNDDEIREDLAC